MNEKIEQALADLSAQEAENEQRFKNAIAAYFETKAAIKAGRQVLAYLQEEPQEQEE